MQKKMFRLNCLKVRYLYLLQNLLATKAKHFFLCVLMIVRRKCIILFLISQKFLYYTMIKNRGGRNPPLFCN